MSTSIENTEPFSPYMKHYFNNTNYSWVDLYEDQIYVQDEIIASLYHLFLETLNEKKVLEPGTSKGSYKIRMDNLHTLSFIDQAVFLKWLKKIDKVSPHSNTEIFLRNTSKEMSVTAKVIVRYAFNNDYVEEETKTVKYGPTVFDKVAPVSIMGLGGINFLSAVPYFGAADVGSASVGIVTGLLFSGIGGVLYRRNAKRAKTPVEEFTGNVVVTNRTKQILLYHAAENLDM